MTRDRRVCTTPESDPFHVKHQLVIGVAKWGVPASYSPFLSLVSSHKVEAQHQILQTLLQHRSNHSISSSPKGHVYATASLHPTSITSRRASFLQRPPSLHLSQTSVIKSPTSSCPAENAANTRAENTSAVALAPAAIETAPTTVQLISRRRSIGGRAARTGWAPNASWISHIFRQ